MIKNLLIISALLSTAAFAADEKKDDEWKVSGRLNAYIQTINNDGNGSSMKEGTTHNEELNLNYTGPVGDGEAGVESRVRVTNDERVQQDDVELLYLRSYYRDKTWSVEAGDVALSLNPYIYSGSVKGAKAVYKSLEKKRTLNYSLLAGFKKASWKELFTQEVNEAPTAYSGALEVKYIHERAKEIAISISGHKDDLSTGGVDSTAAGKEGYGIGLDGKWRFNKYITLKGRTAFTSGKDNIRDNNTSSKSKGAIYLKLLTRPLLKSVKSNFVYQRVDSDFISFGGSGNSDKEQLENSTTWTINKELRARMDLKGNRDNLDGALGDTQYLHYEALSLTYRPSFIKGDMTFRGSNKGLDGRGTDTVTQTAGVDLNLRNKSSWRYGGGYDYSDVDDKNSTSSSLTTHRFNVLLGYKAKVSKVSSYRFTIRPSYLYIENQEDKIGLKLDAGYVYNKQMSMDLLYLLYQVDYSDVNANNTENSTYQARATYKLDTKGSDAIRVLLEKRDVDVDNTADKTYSEYKGKVSLVMSF